MSAPVVSWAGPVEQASQLLRQATDQLERKDFVAGVEQLRQAKAQIDLAMEFIGGETLKRNTTPKEGT